MSPPRSSSPPKPVLVLGATATASVRLCQMRPDQNGQLAALRTDVFAPYLTSTYDRYQKRILIEKSIAKKTAVYVAIATDDPATHISKTTSELDMDGSEILCGSIDVLAVSLEDASQQQRRPSSSSKMCAWLKSVESLRGGASRPKTGSRAWTRS